MNSDPTHHTTSTDDAPLDRVRPVDGPVPDDDEMSGDGGRSHPCVEVVGDAHLAFGRKSLSRMDHLERTCTVACASGDRTTARWFGVPVSALLSAAEVPEETTHVVVEGWDGYRVVVPVRVALSGLLALERDEEPLAETTPYATRFVAPDADGSRMVSGVRRIEATALDPADDPETLEDRWPDAGDAA